MGVQSGTAVAWGFCNTLNMRTDQLKSALMGTWILAVGVLAYISDPRSLAGWTVLAAVAATPPVVMMRLWRVPAQSMSESIREVLR